MSIQQTEPDANYPDLWSRLAVNGINGRGVLRPSKTATVGGRSVTTGSDVTNQATYTTKD